jgi:bisanhydrobacterioruberin hydratase
MKNPKPFIYLLASMYLAGIIGLVNPESRELFQFLTPFHLLTSFVLLIYFQKEKNKEFWSFMAFCTLFGYLIEVAGVKTGLIFGEYKYLTTLGIKVFDVPPMIGINWFIMVFSMGIVVDLILKEKFNIFIKSLIGSSAMTLFDYIAEPVAISQNMWSWKNEIPPDQNYIAWFLVSFVLLFIFNKSNFNKKNILASYILVFQLFFFCILRLFS